MNAEYATSNLGDLVWNEAHFDAQCRHKENFLVLDAKFEKLPSAF